MNTAQVYIEQIGLDQSKFDEKCAGLITFLKESNPNVKILAAGSFGWNDPAD